MEAAEFSTAADDTAAEFSSHDEPQPPSPPLSSPRPVEISSPDQVILDEPPPPSPPLSSPPPVGAPRRDSNLFSQQKYLTAMERRISSGGFSYNEVSIPLGCVEVVITRKTLAVPLGVDLQSGGTMKGTRISGVAPNSIAAESGLLIWDTIVSVNEEASMGAKQTAESLKSSLQLRLMVRRATPAECDQMSRRDSSEEFK